MISNRKAYYNFSILEKLEAGIALNGVEVKSVKAGSASLAESFIRIKDSEAFLVNCYISPYQSQKDYQASRERKLLLHREEIEHLKGKLTSRNLTIVPLKLYNKAGKIKIEIGLAKHKKEHDKRESVKKRIVERETSAQLREEKFRWQKEVRK